MAFYCLKKKLFLFGKKAHKKCINTNIRKRGKICPHLCEKEAEDEASVYSLQATVRMLQPGKQRLRTV